MVVHPLDRLEVVQKSLVLHPTCPGLWLELAHVYLCLHTDTAHTATNHRNTTTTATTTTTTLHAGDNVTFSQNEDKESSMEVTTGVETIAVCDSCVSSKLSSMSLSGGEYSVYDRLEVAPLQSSAVCTGMSLQMVACTCLLRARYRTTLTLTYLYHVYTTVV